MSEGSNKHWKSPSTLSIPREGVSTADERGKSFLQDVYMPPSKVKIVYFQPNKTKLAVSAQSILSRDYLYEVSNSLETTISLIQDPVNQVILMFNVENNHSTLQSLLKKFQSLELTDSVVVVGMLPHFSRSKPSDAIISTLLEFGVSRIISTDEGERRFFHELKMIEANELLSKRILRFSRALKETVHCSHDAIQVSGKDGSIMYVNKSFNSLNGLSPEDCLGRSAVEVLSWLQDNGLRSVFLNKEKWEGEYNIERRSGSTRQRLTLLPVKSPQGQVVNHVSVQRVLASQEVDSPKVPYNFTTPDTGVGHIRYSTSKDSIGSISRINPLPDIPVSASICTTLANIVKDQACPPDIRESLEKCLDTIKSETPQLKHSTRHDIVGGLLGNERQYMNNSDSTRTPCTPLHHHPHHAPSRPPHMIQKCLDSISTWDFNIMELERISNYSPLYYVGMEIFNEFQIPDVLCIEESVLKSWLKLMEASYHRGNKYHNSTHAADVLQGTAYLVRKLQLSLKESQDELLDPLELASLFITAIVHDLDHPGRTNPFLSNSRHKLAILYNDRAVLENHHVAYSFKITLDNPEHNIYKELDNNTFRSLRASLIDLVLATDMSKHFEFLNKFKRYQLSSQVEDVPVGSSTSLISPGNQEGRMLMKRILVKCADISNASRPLPLCREWASRVAEEYFSQTEEEKQKGLPVIFRDFERETCKLPVTQVKFVDFFVFGLFEAWHYLCPIPDMMEHVNSNYSYWKGQCQPSDLSSEEEVEEATSNQQKDS